MRMLQIAWLLWWLMTGIVLQAAGVAPSAMASEPGAWPAGQDLGLAAWPAAPEEPLPVTSELLPQNGSAPAAEAASDAGDDDATEDASEDSRRGWCQLGDPWTLFANDNRLHLAVGGWTQIGYHSEGLNGAGLGYFNDYPHRVQLQQQWFWIEKASDTEKHDIDWGFRLDYVYGTDGPNTQSFGSRPNHWDNPWDNGIAYGHAIPQLYGEVAIHKLKIKLGHFFTVEGYEVVPATGNFFYSHSYSMNFTEPFTHTGVLSEWALREDLTLWAGWTAGWDTGFNRNGGDLFMGGFSSQISEKVKATYICTLGDFGFQDTADSDPDGYSHSVVIVWSVNDRWEYVFDTDYIHNDRFIGPGSADEAFSINQYLFYGVNDCFRLGARFEYYDNDGFGDENQALTFGANVRTHANLVVRPEVRWDWFGSDFAGPAGVGPRDEATFAVDFVATF